MVFADFFNDLLGSSCIIFVLIVLGIGWLLSAAGNAAGKVLKNEDFREGAKVGFWWWWINN